MPASSGSPHDTKVTAAAPGALVQTSLVAAHRKHVTILPIKVLRVILIVQMK